MYTDIGERTPESFFALFLDIYLLFRFKRGFYYWVIILNFSSFSIILFAVDLSFPTFVSNMSVVVIFRLRGGWDSETSGEKSISHENLTKCIFSNKVHFKLIIC